MFFARWISWNLLVENIIWKYSLYVDLNVAFNNGWFRFSFPAAGTKIYIKYTEFQKILPRWIWENNRLLYSKFLLFIRYYSAAGTTGRATYPTLYMISFTLNKLKNNCLTVYQDLRKHRYSSPSPPPKLWTFFKIFMVIFNHPSYVWVQEIERKKGVFIIQFVKTNTLTTILTI